MSSKRNDNSDDDSVVSGSDAHSDSDSDSVSRKRKSHSRRVPVLPVKKAPKIMTKKPVDEPRIVIVEPCADDEPVASPPAADPQANEPVIDANVDEPAAVSDDVDTKEPLAAEPSAPLPTSDTSAPMDAQPAPVADANAEPVPESDTKAEPAPESDKPAKPKRYFAKRTPADKQKPTTAVRHRNRPAASWLEMTYNDLRRSRVRNLLHQSGAVLIAGDAPHTARMVYMSILADLVTAATIVATGERRRTIKPQHVRLAAIARFNTHLFS